MLLGSIAWLCKQKRAQRLGPTPFPTIPYLTFFNMSMIFPNLTATFARILTLSECSHGTARPSSVANLSVSGVLGLLGILVCCPGAAAEVKNSLVGYCGSDSKCRDYKDWSQVLYDPANKTAGYMGSCDVCAKSRPTRPLGTYVR